ncbi:MAG: Crp/Fnr family transcriptional regulator, partial [Pseudomonadota bacterium]
MASIKSEADLEFKRRILTSAPVFRATSEDDLMEIARCGKLVAIQRGKPLNKTGADQVFIVQSGVVVNLQPDHEKTKPVLAAIFGPGDMCGMQQSLTRTAADAGLPGLLTCLSNVSALAVPTADILRVSRREPELSQALMTCLSMQLSKMARLLAQSLHRPLELRLASLFSMIGDLIAGDDWRPTVEIGRISQSFAAEMLGVSREHVNRTLTMWEKSGLIFQNKSSEILIQNRKRLATLAHDKFAAPQAVRDGDWLWEIDSYLDFGLNQTAFHLAMEASRRAPRDMRFRHRAVLATARSGAQAEALALIDKLGLKHDYSDEELACLRPRILRDMAFSTADDKEKHAYLVDAAEEYAKTFEKCRRA